MWPREPCLARGAACSCWVGLGRPWRGERWAACHRSNGGPPACAGLGCPWRAGGEAWGEVVGGRYGGRRKIQFALDAGCRPRPRKEVVAARVEGRKVLCFITVEKGRSTKKRRLRVKERKRRSVLRVQCTTGCKSRRRRDEKALWARERGGRR